MSDVQRHAQLTTETLLYLRGFDARSIEQLHDHLNTKFDDVTEDELTTVLSVLEDDHLVEQIDGLWTYKQQPSALRGAVEHTRELGLLENDPRDEDLEPIELLAHYFNLADWRDVQHNQTDTSLLKEYEHVKKQLINRYLE